MKLITYTSRIQLAWFLILFGLFSIIFYLVLSWTVMKNVDEVLHNRKVKLMTFLEQNPKTPFEEENPLDDFTFIPVDEETLKNGKKSYTDTLIYEPVDNELDEYRKLTTYVELEGNYYKLEIIRPHLETADLIRSTAIILGGLFLGLMLCFYLSQRFIFKNIWKPFYQMLDILRHFRLDKREAPKIRYSKIDEFEMLNEAVRELAGKNLEVFESQKQFIENASHEMQTPLSIIQSRLETLIGQEELTESQAVIVEGIISSTQRLKKLNKTLLLLSKIENQEFLLTEEIDLREIIRHSLAYYEEQKETMNIELYLDFQSPGSFRGNKMLTEILIQNLLKNAFLHNTSNGWVKIYLDENQLTITNTGSTKPIEEHRLFERFYKASNDANSWGLGLAIASKIVKVSQWTLHYEQKNSEHRFSIYF